MRSIHTNTLVWWFINYVDICSHVFVILLLFIVTSTDKLLFLIHIQKRNREKKMCRIFTSFVSICLGKMSTLREALRLLLLLVLGALPQNFFLNVWNQKFLPSNRGRWWKEKKKHFENQIQFDLHMFSLVQHKNVNWIS